MSLRAGGEPFVVASPAHPSQHRGGSNAGLSDELLADADPAGAEFQPAWVPSAAAKAPLAWYSAEIGSSGVGAAGAPLRSVRSSVSACSSSSSFGGAGGVFWEGRSGGACGARGRCDGALFRTPHTSAALSDEARAQLSAHRRSPAAIAVALACRSPNVAVPRAVGRDGCIAADVCAASANRSPPPIDEAATGAPPACAPPRQQPCATIARECASAPVQAPPAQPSAGLPPHSHQAPEFVFDLDE